MRHSRLIALVVVAAASAGFAFGPQAPQRTAMYHGTWIDLNKNEALVGESRSRTSLDLTGFQLKLVRAVREAGKSTVLVLLNGRPLSINWIQVALDVTNTGSRAGDDIAQLCLNDEVGSIVYHERVSLKAGEKARLRSTLTPGDLKLLDRDMTWTVEPGTFQVLVGASSEDIRLRGAFGIK